jgi:hypothetical protein
MTPYVAQGLGGRRKAGACITEIEQHWQLQFPPDYRLFLKTLHCMNKKIIGFDEECMGMKEYDHPTYSNWQTHLLERP